MFSRHARQVSFVCATLRSCLILLTDCCITSLVRVSKADFSSRVRAALSCQQLCKGSSVSRLRVRRCVWRVGASSVYEASSYRSGTILCKRGALKGYDQRSAGQSWICEEHGTRTASPSPILALQQLEGVAGRGAWWPSNSRSYERWRRRRGAETERHWMAASLAIKEACFCYSILTLIYQHLADYLS